MIRKLLLAVGLVLAITAASTPSPAQATCRPGYIGTQKPFIVMPQCEPNP